MKLTTTSVASAVIVLLAAWWWMEIDLVHLTTTTTTTTAVQSVIIRGASEVELLPIDGAFGGESIAFDSAGHGPYAGVSDGRILKWDRITRRWHGFAFTSPNRRCDGRSGEHEKDEDRCGRPLGLRFHRTTGNLYIADAYMGLLVVGPNGGLATSIWTEDKNISSFGFANGLDIDESNGVIYFTASSTRYQRRNYLAAFITGDSTGRFMKYDMKSKRASILLDNLKFPNGVSLSNDGKSVLIIESVTCKVLRYYLQSGLLETLVELPGFPDNIKRNANGEHWVGVYSKKTRLSEFVLARPRLGNFIATYPWPITLAQAILRMKAVGMGFKLSEKGDIIQAFQDQTGLLRFVSEVEDREGHLFFGSVIMPFVAVYTQKSRF